MSRLGDAQQLQVKALQKETPVAMITVGALGGTSVTPTVTPIKVNTIVGYNQAGVVVPCLISH